MPARDKFSQCQPTNDVVTSSSVLSELMVIARLASLLPVQALLQRIRTLKEINLNFLATEQYAFHLDMPACVPQLFRSRSADLWRQLKTYWCIQDPYGVYKIHRNGKGAN
jgi:hypothetical protein